ncbi:MAG: N-acetylmuramoyl-L-alanine amidase [Coprococcus sp.]
MKGINFKSIQFIYMLICIFSILCAFILYGCHHKENSHKDISANDISYNSEMPEMSESSESTAMDFIITIDPGHGGFDPGKVSADGIKEKDINLSISLKLKQKLEDMGFIVYITRDSDTSLDDKSNGSKKMSDLNNRILFAADNNSDLMLSIHQNSFSGTSVHGAQVFYYDTSEEGRLLAGFIQEQIRITADTDNKREIKGNTEYLLLAKSTCTSVIVECGFLSNTDECKKLCSEEYQELLASAIADAVMKYYQSKKETAAVAGSISYILWHRKACICFSMQAPMAYL